MFALCAFVRSIHAPLIHNSVCASCACMAACGCAMLAQRRVQACMKPHTARTLPCVKPVAVMRVTSVRPFFRCVLQAWVWFSHAYVMPMRADVAFSCTEYLYQLNPCTIKYMYNVDR